MSEATELMFGLLSDKATAKVRFLYRSIDEIIPVKVHAVYKENDEGHTAIYNVKCLDDECPLCKAGQRVYSRLYIPIYNEGTKSVQIWERGSLAYKSMKFSKLFEKFPYLPKHTFTVTRHGNFGDRCTFYSINPEGSIDIQELKATWEIPDPKNVLYHEISAEEMMQFIDGTE